MGAACGRRISAQAPRMAKAPHTAGPSRTARREAQTRQPLAAAPHHLAKHDGCVDDAYVLEERVGEGTFGSVWRARHRHIGTARAVKTVRKGRPSQVQGLRKEISTMCVMDHPNIIKLFETFEDSRCIHLVMELASGGELFDRIVEAHHFCERQAAVIMRQVLRAVNHMHDRDVAHRDLKPENFLFATKAPVEENTLKLIDFGAACHCAPEQVLTSRVGTLLYMSPQVLAGRYGRTCDMWSVGVVMYILLGGRPPIRGSSDRETAMRVRDGRWSFDGAHWEQVSAHAKALITAMLRRHARSRISAGEALAHVWVQQTAPQARRQLGAALLERLRGFEAGNRLRQAAMEIAARELSDAKIHDLREAFEALDSDQDGKLSVAELADGLERSGIGLEHVDARSIVARIDANHSGAIDYTEFLAATLDRKADLTEEVLWMAFNAFDRNGDGKVTTSDLQHVLRCACVGCAEEVMASVDANGDGTIDFGEFVAMMKAADRRATLLSSAQAGALGGA
eukprot:CAMPEP_0176051412 /NCGR_PEP_ID=MMETSP0120_2-20121206/25560_1 /TAXON_ID=160619 /ORGANISM="Kryptoperidinium foliaceum, Strain CCMP 1326" /LENGTH=510 /DNA_ID=CAMNT_0017384853 /DNA_START=21 /DNA_END=1553 /DNA_ORIENTATION=-